MEPGSDAGKLRLFVAFGLPQTIRDKVADLQQKLKPFARDAKWVNPNGIHLTLKFLGYVDPEKVPGIEKILLDCSERFSSANIEIAGIGFFPNQRRPNVLWAGVNAPGIFLLQKEIEENLVSLSFEKENRAFSPHLTLARFRDPRGLLPLTKETERLKDVSIGEFLGDHISLYRSILHRQGAEYIVLKEFNLTAKINPTETSR